ncbi:MAG: hypothetical protein ABJ314_04455, partial [Ilumatobacter sp.]
MTSEPPPVHHSATAPPRAAANLGLAERYATFADYAVSTVAVPQTAATSLDVARFHAFTGEITFAIDPAVRLYLDGGSIYHAERDGDPSLSRLILDAGAIDSVQLQRGVIGVGGAEHLGRLFDRDATVDRDLVMVIVENATDAIVQQLANSVTATITVSAYRHHPSGIHRWFVASSEPTGVHRPSSGVMQVDRSVVEELPRLGSGGQLPHPKVPVAHDMRIEWAEPDPSGLGIAAPPDGRSTHESRDDATFDIQAELDRFDADRADWTAGGGDVPEASESVASPLGEFRIVWPDGTRDDSIIDARWSPTAGPTTQSEQPADTAQPTAPPSFPDPRSESTTTESTATGAATTGLSGAEPPADVGDPFAADLIEVVPVAAMPLSDASPTTSSTTPPTTLSTTPPTTSSTSPSVDETIETREPGRSTPSDSPSLDAPGPGPLGFTIEPLQIDQIPEPDAAVPDDVAAAVRRALQAIESAAARPRPATVSSVELAPVVPPELALAPPTATPAPAPTPSQAPTPARAPAATETPTPAAFEAPNFAPPTALSAPTPLAPAAQPSPAARNEPLGFAPPT